MIHQLGKHKVEMYEDIENMPVVRFHKYNKMLIVEAGIGSDVAAADSHLAKIAALVRQKDCDKALQEIANMQQCLYFAAESVSPRLLAFSALGRSIDGDPCDDLTDEGLTATAAKLSDVPVAQIAAVFAGVKKKIDEALRLYFPKSFDDAEVKEYYDCLRSRALCQLEAIQAGGGDGCIKGEIARLSDAVLTFFAPQPFGGSEGVEVRHDKGIEYLCLALAQNMHVNAKKMTVMEFYNALEYAREEARKQKKQTKR